MPAAGFGIIIGIILLLVAAGIILWVVISSASKAEEKTQIELCRTSNVIRVGTEAEYLSGWVDSPLHSPRVCGTIYKTKKELQLPTKKYKERYEGEGPRFSMSDKKLATVAEIADMVKNCWYMWLEGSDERVFPDRLRDWGRKGCHVCYMFKFKGSSGISVTDLRNVMHNLPYFAEDSSDKCAPGGGGIFMLRWGRTTCPSGWEEVKESKVADMAGTKCCVVKDCDECECINKGGSCSSGSTKDFPFRYDKWSCPEEAQKCYVREEYYYSYLRYIEKYGDRGGGIQYIDIDDIVLRGTINALEVNAISFYSREDDTPLILISKSDHTKVVDWGGLDTTECEIK